MGIREEAFPFAGPPALLAAALGALGLYLWALPFLVAALCVCAFFRDPRRLPPEDPELLVSAADGRVLKVEESDEALKISVFMSVFSVHVNRAPYAGRVDSVQYNPGKFLAAWDDKASMDNEQTRIALATDRGRIDVVQIAGLVARRIVCWAVPGRSFERGESLGLIRFGSRVDHYLPPGRVEVLVKPGDSVRAGVTPIVRWKKEPA
jgi:phosphatidylserine decarboxylase